MVRDEEATRPLELEECGPLPRGRTHVLVVGACRSPASRVEAGAGAGLGAGIGAVAAAAAAGVGSGGWYLLSTVPTHSPSLHMHACAPVVVVVRVEVEQVHRAGVATDREADETVLKVRVEVGAPQPACLAQRGSQLHRHRRREDDQRARRERHRPELVRALRTFRGAARRGAAWCGVHMRYAMQRAQLCDAPAYASL